MHVEGHLISSYPTTCILNDLGRWLNPYMCLLQGCIVLCQLCTHIMCWWTTWVTLTDFATRANRIMCRFCGACCRWTNHNPMLYWINANQINYIINEGYCLTIGTYVPALSLARVIAWRSSGPKPLSESIVKFRGNLNLNILIFIH